MSIKICHISDTHLRDFNPESADILCHSGDALNYGNFEELTKFRKQLADIHKNYTYIVYVPGNHDRWLESSMDYSVDFLREEVPNIHVLHNSSIELNGLKFYGTADNPVFCNWAFNKYPEELMQSYANIPDDVEVLITHCPPKGILDSVYGKSVGSPELAYQYPRLKNLKAHLWGHIHYSYGKEMINGIQYSNAAICNESYLAVNEANIIEVENGS